MNEIKDSQRIVLVPNRDWKLDKTKVYKQEDKIKPTGLWYSAGSSWLNWCEAEVFIDSGYIFELFFDSDKLLRLKTTHDLLVFTHKYLEPLEGIETKYKNITGSINWARVKAEHKHGIEIAPYNWELRLELMWYYGWDCASGCIWDLSIIDGVKYFDEWKVKK